jgi:Protein of unknown function (DUF550)
MVYDFVAHLTRQMVFSKATFGHGERMTGVIDHIGKEVAEVVASNGASSEWVDVVILSLDGLTRRLWAEHPTKPADEIAWMAVRLILDKQGKNELRDWPDWRTADPDKAIEHVKLPTPTMESK